MSTERPFRIVVLALTLVVVALIGAPARGQDRAEPDPAAAKAFKEMMQAYRKHPALKVTAELKITLIQADAEADAEAESSTVKATFISAGPTKGVVELNGFTCYFGDGTFQAIHKEEEHSFYSEEFEGAPYWWLWM